MADLLYTLRSIYTCIYIKYKIYAYIIPISTPVSNSIDLETNKS